MDPRGASTALHGGLHGPPWGSVEVFTEAHGAPWSSAEVSMVCPMMMDTVRWCLCSTGSGTVEQQLCLLFQFSPTKYVAISSFRQFEFCISPA